MFGLGVAPARAESRASMSASSWAAEIVERAVARGFGGAMGVTTLDRRAPRRELGATKVEVVSVPWSDPPADEPE